MPKRADIRQSHDLEGESSGIAFLGLRNWQQSLIQDSTPAHQSKNVRTILRVGLLHARNRLRQPERNCHASAPAGEAVSSHRDFRLHGVLPRCNPRPRLFCLGVPIPDRDAHCTVGVGHELPVPTPSDRNVLQLNERACLGVRLTGGLQRRFNPCARAVD